MAVATEAVATLPSTRKPCSESTRAEILLLNLSNQFGDQPPERLRSGFGMGRWFLQAKRGTRRRVGGLGSQRFRLATEHSVERIDDIVGSPEPPCERQPRNVHQCADGLEAKPFKGAYRIRI
jgi:hypothetical protein